MEKRRKNAGKLFNKGCSAPEVSRRLGVARQVAYRWKEAWQSGGTAALASKGPAGRKSKMTAEQTQQVTQALLAGPVAHGYKTALWTLPRVADLIEELTGVRYIPVTFGGCWVPAALAVSGRNAGQSSVTKRPSAGGSALSGRL